MTKKTCLECGNYYQPTGSNQKYCGSITLKQGCSHKIHTYRKTHDKNGNLRQCCRPKYIVENEKMLENAVCLRCGTKEKLSIDHIRPQFIGGTHDRDNLQVLCRSCNSKRHHKLRRNAFKYYFKAGFTD
jgi:5-methylcytosine-specific restriction endonuclease McrA